MNVVSLKERHFSSAEAECDTLMYSRPPRFLRLDRTELGCLLFMWTSVGTESQTRSMICCLYLRKDAGMTVCETSNRQTSCFVAFDETPRTANGERLPSKEFRCPISLLHAPRQRISCGALQFMHTGFEEERYKATWKRGSAERPPRRPFAGRSSSARDRSQNRCT